MSMKTAVNRGGTMVKQSPFQEDLFDFKYIEDQVSAIKQTMENVENIDDEREIREMLNEQLNILYEINNTLEKMNESKNKKKGWFNFKD